MSSSNAYDRNESKMPSKWILKAVLQNRKEGLELTSDCGGQVLFVLRSKMTGQNMPGVRFYFEMGHSPNRLTV